MSKPLTLIKQLTIAFVCFLLLAWFHHQFVVTPLDYANKDFMSLWTGGRAILKGVNPYDPAVWGPLRASYGSEWFPDSSAPFPLWTSLILLPFALLPLDWAAAVWLSFSELLLGLSAYWIFRYLAPLTPKPVEVGTLLLGLFASIVTILVLINGQMTFLLLAWLVLFLIFWERGKPFTAGFFLALIITKPNPFILFAPLLGLWLIWQKQWRVIAGGATSGLLLLTITWLIQPGWLWEWMAVRSKTAVVTITPTLWGLAAEIAPDHWFVVGMALVVGFTAVLGWFIFARPTLPMPVIVSLAITGSLLVTPYGWAYEHALLFIPWILLFATLQPRQRALWIWIGLAWIMPWVMFGVAAVRINDALGFAVPLTTLIITFWWSQKRPLPNQRV